MLRFARNLILYSLVSTSVFACAGSAGPGQIAFESDRDGNWEIYVMDADGTNVRQLTDNDHDDTSPGWSSDGKQIAFTSDRYGDDKVLVMDADGTNIRDLNQSGRRPSYKP